MIITQVRFTDRLIRINCSGKAIVGNVVHETEPSFDQRMLLIPNSNPPTRSRSMECNAGRHHNYVRGENIASKHAHLSKTLVEQGHLSNAELTKQVPMFILALLAI